jgi:hypothetical protein
MDNPGQVLCQMLRVERLEGLSAGLFYLSNVVWKNWLGRKLSSLDDVYSASRWRDNDQCGGASLAFGGALGFTNSGCLITTICRYSYLSQLHKSYK